MTEEKSKGSSIDPTGTWTSLIRVPTDITQKINEWSKVNITDINHIWQSVDSKVVKGGIVTGDRDINILLLIQNIPSIGLIRYLSEHTKRFDMRFGQIKCFPREYDINTKQAYHVLYVEVEAPYLIELQQIIGTVTVPEGFPPLRWHHEIYNPHITLGFIKAEFIELYLNKSFSIDKVCNIDSFIIKKYQDKSFTPINVQMKYSEGASKGQIYQ